MKFYDDRGNAIREPEIKKTKQLDIKTAREMFPNVTFMDTDCVSIITTEGNRKFLEVIPDFAAIVTKLLSSYQKIGSEKLGTLLRSNVVMGLETKLIAQMDELRRHIEIGFVCATIISIDKLVTPTHLVEYTVKVREMTESSGNLLIRKPNGHWDEESIIPHPRYGVPVYNTVYMPSYINHIYSQIGVYASRRSSLKYAADIWRRLRADMLNSISPECKKFFA